MQTQGSSERETAEAAVGQLSCAACHGPVTNGAAARCPECRALYHVPCWNDLTGCVTPGCRGHRRVPNRGPLTLVSEPVEVLSPPEPGAGIDEVVEIEVEVDPVRLPAPRIELLPEPERPEGVRARRHSREWISTAVVAVVALVAGIAGTLALVHHGDAKAHDSGYSSGFKTGYRQGATGSFDSGYKKGDQAGWKSGYERGFLEGCHAAKGPDAQCFNPVIPADGDGASTPTTGPSTAGPSPSGSTPPASGAQPVGATRGGFVPRLT